MPKRRGDTKVETVSIRLPEEMIKRIETLIESNPELGYVSVPEFVREAIRDKLIELEFFIKAKKGEIEPDMVIEKEETKF